MSDPRLPYLTVPDIPIPWLGEVLRHVFGLREAPTLKPFGTLVALGVYVGSTLALRHARRRGLDPRKMIDVSFWVVAGGFLGGHLLDALLYHPAEVVRDPLLLVKVWDGLSSFGGFAGAVLGGFLWKLRRREPSLLGYADMMSSAFPAAWVFGRLGCAIAHDHPGRRSDLWLAVRYPDGDGVVGRFDLGLYELVITLPLAAAFLILSRGRPRPFGFYSAVMCLSYAPARFLLDFLREVEGAGVPGGDPRYAGLTPAQWACFGLFLLGLHLARLARAAPDPGLAGDAHGAGT